MMRSNPYIGPKPYQRNDGYLFCGRDYEVQKLLNLLIAEQILLLYAPSGAGKTSLINKAVIPKLEEKNFLVLPVMRVSRLLPAEILKQVKVKNRYVFSALLALEKFREGAAESYQLTPEELTRLQQLAEMPFIDYLKGVSARQMEKREEARVAAAEPNQTPQENPKRVPSKIVLIFDQFEEILSVDPADYDVKTDFFKQVGDALFTEDYWALFSMREDNAASLGSLVRQLPSRLETRFRLELLSTEKAEEAIKKPALSQSTSFQPEAVQKLIDDLRTVKAQSLAGQTEEKQGDFVEPMQLQVVCYRLWQNLGLSYNRKDEITTEDLKGTHVNEALAEFYEDCLEEASQEGGKTEEEIRQWIEDELITPGRTRGSVFMAQNDAAGMPRKVVEKLQERHLLRGEYRAGAHWYELTHDRFIEPIKESNRPWAALKIASKRASRAHSFAVLWFLGLALLWLLVEFFVTDPVRESRMFAANNARLTNERKAVLARQKTIDSVLEATKSNEQAKLTSAHDNVRKERQTIYDEHQKLINEAKAAQPPKSPPGRPRKKLEDVNTLETALRESAPLNATMAKIREGSKNKWQGLSLTSDDVSVLKSLASPVEPHRRVSRWEFENRPAPPSYVALTEAAGSEELNPEKLKQSIESFDTDEGKKNWSDLQLDLFFEKAATVALNRIRKPVEDLKLANDQQLAEINVLNLTNRGVAGAAATRSAQTRKESKIESTELQAALQQPQKETDGSSRIRKFLTDLWDPTIPAERATAVVYLTWCVVLIAFMIYLTISALDLEERVGRFLEVLTRVKAVRDPLGWDIKRQIPSVLVLVALACLVAIHVRVSWICFDVVRAGAKWWWGLLFIPGLLTANMIAYYVIMHYRHDQIARARMLEVLKSFNELKASFKTTLTNR